MGEHTTLLDLLPGVRDLLRQALGKAPSDRFASAREFAEALRNLAQASNIALGAQSTDIVGWTLRTGLVPAVVGLVVGGAGALALSRLLGAQLYDVSPTDPVVFGSVAAVLLLVALLASGVPARRAARVDPAVALRSE